ncbi:cell growth regulator with RING finger domain protein 1 isoform X2 [Pelobates fuscus]|uniref:cell growth regulator with RING finger domain protein 1 isoform X2 n=1 Tax=Pelobates fuscus TaxID=191477 RepID=UPI002FE4918F
MPALFLATLYEYSPLFYITVVFVCFVITSGLVLGWFGVDVPIILRNSEETESASYIYKKQMREVTNPFGLDIVSPSTASVKDGIAVNPNCLEDCLLTFYWGCSVKKIQEALQRHIYCSPIQTPTVLEDSLYNEYLHKEQHNIRKQTKEEIYIQLPTDHKIEDFGPVPRTRYPLIALLTLSDGDTRELYDIQLFMSANSSRSESPRDSPSPVPSDGDFLEDAGKDCVVCQNDGVNWVLLPCRHACLCDGCLAYFHHCPICRQFVQESFPLHSRGPRNESHLTPGD